MDTYIYIYIYIYMKLESLWFGAQMCRCDNLDHYLPIILNMYLVTVIILNWYLNSLMVTISNVNRLFTKAKLI